MYKDKLALFAAKLQAELGQILAALPLIVG